MNWKLLLKDIGCLFLIPIMIAALPLILILGGVIELAIRYKIKKD